MVVNMCTFVKLEEKKYFLSFEIFSATNQLFCCFFFQGYDNLKQIYDIA